MNEINSPLDIQQTYSSEFSMSLSTFKTSLLIWSAAMPNKVIYIYMCEYIYIYILYIYIYIYIYIF